MKNEHLLIICTRYNSWTSGAYFKAFRLELSESSDQIKAITFREASEDYLANPIPSPDIIVFNEDIHPAPYPEDWLRDIIQQKQSIYLILHQVNISAYKNWIQKLAESKPIVHRQEHSTNTRTTELLVQLANVHTRDEAQYYQLLEDYFLGRRQDELEELKFNLLNRLNDQFLAYLHTPAGRESVSLLLENIPKLETLLDPSHTPDDPQSWTRYKQQIARILFGDFQDDPFHSL